MNQGVRRYIAPLRRSAPGVADDERAHDTGRHGDHLLIRPRIEDIRLTLQTSPCPSLSLKFGLPMTTPMTISMPHLQKRRPTSLSACSRSTRLAPSPSSVVGTVSRGQPQSPPPIGKVIRLDKSRLG